jgi:hypothetical protein
MKIEENGAAAETGGWRNHNGRGGKSMKSGRWCAWRSSWIGGNAPRGVIATGMNTIHHICGLGLLVPNIALYAADSSVILWREDGDSILASRGSIWC